MRGYRVESQVMAKKPMNQKRITAELVAAEAMAVVTQAERELFAEMGDGSGEPSRAALAKLHAAFVEKERAVNLWAQAELEDEEQERIARVGIRRPLKMAPPAPAVESPQETSIETITTEPVTEGALMEFAKPLTPDELAAIA